MSYPHVLIIVALLTKHNSSHCFAPSSHPVILVCSERLLYNFSSFVCFFYHSDMK